jgi:chromosome segregation ATPase
MSDEAYDVALGVLRGFTMGEEVGSQALAVVESQNQALQERAEKAEARKDVWHERFEAVAEEARALQERAEKAEARSEQLEGLKFQYLDEKEHWMTRAQQTEAALKRIRDSKHAVPPVDASECRAIARDALSPTQETDPE